MKQCACCIEPATRIIYVKDLDAYLCSKCYQRHSQRKNAVKHDLPPFAEVKLDTDGNPICHICGYAFKKLMSHSWQAHRLPAAEYKKRFGLFTTKAVCAESTKEMLRTAVAKHFDKVVIKNLTKAGGLTRYTKGHEGRTTRHMSEQLRRQLMGRNKGKKPEVWVSRLNKKEKV